MIDIRKLKELVKLMVENELTELDLRDQEETVTIKRGHDGQPILQGYAPQPYAPPAAGGSGGPEASESGSAAASGDADTTGFIAIESPMVGTFYTAPNPDSDPFVATGSQVSKDTTVCLIEAMKVFNEIKAETSGTVERMLVENGEAVEFGQKLFLIRPA